MSLQQKSRINVCPQPISIPLSEFFFKRNGLSELGRAGKAAMKIGIDASAVVGEKSGVGWYTTSLIEALATVDHHNQYVLYPFFTMSSTRVSKNWLHPPGAFPSASQPFPRL